MDDIVVLQGHHSIVVLACSPGQSPALIYWGETVEAVGEAGLFRTLVEPQIPHGGSQDFAHASLSCELGGAYFGPAGLLTHGEDQNWAPLLKVVRYEHAQGDEEHSVVIDCSDPASQIEVQYRIGIDTVTDLVQFSTRLCDTRNSCAGDLPARYIDWASVVCFAAPPQLTDVISFSGRWAGEFNPHRQALTQQGFISENRRGRTSQDSAPSIVLCEATTSERSGECLGLHLGWSGNYCTRVDALHDGRRIVQIGEHFAPGEMQLHPGADYTTPTLYGTFSPAGLSAMSQNFHRFYRRHMRDERVVARPRPVHYNTWEGIYFDHDMPKLLALAETAAELGIERFVLDDGWFLGRRDDTKGLGDWFVDTTIYPDGLAPLIDVVNQHGMEFGLWVEPEMVNPDSNLYREHPDWVLAAPHAPQLGWRNQLVLDLARDDVHNYLFERIDALLRDHNITYLKWDMNRDLTHPGSQLGASHAATALSDDGSGAGYTVNRPRTHQQTIALYRLIDKLRRVHPRVEIESCASGGARADFGILSRTDRIWTSDSNDALDRQRIQRGASLFFPLSVLGAHVGPRRCHITGRTLSMGLRTTTALFGHMGVEANLLDMTNQDRTQLAAGIQLYKKHRALIDEGDLYRLDRPTAENSIAVVAQDKHHALLSHVELDTNPNTQVTPLRLAGLNPSMHYHVNLVWPPRIASAAAQNAWSSKMYNELPPISGDLLMKVGIQPPLLHPQSGVIFELSAV